MRVAGLLKGSTVDGAGRVERPKTLRRLRNVYGEMASVEDKRPVGADDGLGVLSPFDEQEEWAKISEIMASIGTAPVRESVFVSELEQEFQARLGQSLYQTTLL